MQSYIIASTPFFRLLTIQITIRATFKQNFQSSHPRKLASRVSLPAIKKKKNIQRDRSGENRKEHGQLQRSPSPLSPSPRGENRLKRGESFLIPREDRAAALVFFINRNYEKNLAELLPGHPLRENRPTLRKTVSTSEKGGREGDTKGIRWRGSRQQLGKPVHGFSTSPPFLLFFVPIKTESSRTQISLEPFPTHLEWILIPSTR